MEKSPVNRTRAVEQQQQYIITELDKADALVNTNTHLLTHPDALTLDVSLIYY